ncbi:hypothetical protein GYB61_06795 [bacterium]|nr:hypothetical protein [bacterium]
MNLWVCVRLGIVLATAVTSFFVPLEAQAAPHIGWPSLSAISAFCCVAIVLVIGLQALNPLSAKVWRVPAWHRNPFNFRDPGQFFHLGAFVFLAQGVVMLVRFVFSSVAFYPELLLPLAIGGSVLIGLSLVSVVFRFKYREQ